MFQRLKYLVRSDPLKGRYTVATERIRAGELVLRTEPFAAVPTQPLCDRICASTFAIDWVRFPHYLRPISKEGATSSEKNRSKKGGASPGGRLIGCPDCNNSFYASQELMIKARTIQCKSPYKTPFDHTAFECSILSSINKQYERTRAATKNNKNLAKTMSKLTASGQLVAEPHQFTEARILLRILINRARELQEEEERDAMMRSDEAEEQEKELLQLRAQIEDYYCNHHHHQHYCMHDYDTLIANAMEQQRRIRRPRFSDFQMLISNVDKLGASELMEKYASARFLHDLISKQLAIRRYEQRNGVSASLLFSSGKKNKSKNNNNNNNNNGMNIPMPPMHSIDEKFVEHVLRGVEVEDMVNMICQYDCNSFGMWDRDAYMYGVAIYPEASFFNHACAPNLAKWFDGPTLCIYALRDIEPGEELNITYIELDQPLEYRQALLRQNYYFDCRCPRCVAEMDAGANKKNRIKVHKGNPQLDFEAYSCPDTLCCGLLIPPHDNNNNNVPSTMNTLDQQLPPLYVLNYYNDPLAPPPIPPPTPSSTTTASCGRHHHHHNEHKEGGRILRHSFSSSLGTHNHNHNHNHDAKQPRVCNICFAVEQMR